MDLLQLMINSQNSKEIDTHKGNRGELHRGHYGKTHRKGAVLKMCRKFSRHVKISAKLKKDTCAERVDSGTSWKFSGTTLFRAQKGQV